VKYSKISFILFFLIIFIVSCGGGGESSVTTNPPTPAVKVESDLKLAGFPHQIDIYNTSAANKAVVFLHGGGGLKYEFAFELGLNLVDEPPTTASVNWAWLNTNKILAVFPQGQAIPAAPSAYTWDNHVMVSGEDDTAFLQSLAGYIKSQYGISDIYLAGHSNGGMMVNRFWCESPDTFKAYISLSGPASSYYLPSGSTPCKPGITKPYYGIVGGQDNVLQVAGNWDKPTWTLSPSMINSTNSPAYVDPISTIFIGEWSSQQLIRSPLMCNEAPVLADGISNGVIATWNNCNGRLKLQEVLLGAHTIGSLETQSGQKMRDLIMLFINQLQ